MAVHCTVYAVVSDSSLDAGRRYGVVTGEPSQLPCHMVGMPQCLYLESFATVLLDPAGAETCKNAACSLRRTGRLMATACSSTRAWLPLAKEQRGF